MTESAQPLGVPEPWADRLDHLRARIPKHVRDDAIRFLLSDGADANRAIEGYAKIAKCALLYVLLGPYTPQDARTTRREIEQLAKASARLQALLDNMSPDASGTLRFELGQMGGVGLFGSALGGLGGSPSLTTYLRFKSDLRALIPNFKIAAKFRAKVGRKGNAHAHALFWETISTWTEAAGKPPTGAQVDGLATSALLRVLRQIVYAVADDEAVREALTDDVFLGVLSKFNALGALPLGKQATLADILAPPRRRRGRPSRK